MKNKADVGDKIGRLFIKDVYQKDFGTYKKKVAVCECECGNEVLPMLSDIRAGKTLSCGCLSKDIASERAIHGLSKHPLYHVWRGMLSRCYDTSHKSYVNYGGRGISVCAEWRFDVSKFIEDMYPNYEKGLDLDREDNDGNYCQDNCRWVARKVNLRNKRPPSDVSSKYKGVSFHKTKEKWTAFILDVNGKQIWLGRHSSEKEAARISYKAHKEYYGYWPPYCDEHLEELSLMED